MLDYLFVCFGPEKVMCILVADSEQVYWKAVMMLMRFLSAGCCRGTSWTRGRLGRFVLDYLVAFKRT
jgi:hypothetical protein